MSAVATIDWPRFDVPDRVLSPAEEREALGEFVAECEDIGVPLEGDALRRRARRMLRKHSKAKRAGEKVA